MSKYDVIIVGAGSMGMSAGFQLAQDNKKVLLIDANNPPHIYGSHSGKTRLIRNALGGGAYYVPLAIRSQEIMRQFQESINPDYFVETGVLTFGHAESEVVKAAIQAAEDYQINTEIFNSGEKMNERWQGLDLPAEYIGIYEPQAGIVDADIVIKFFKQSALELGAELITDTPVETIEVVNENTVRVKTQHTIYEAEKVIISAGFYTNQLLETLELQLAVQPNRHTVTWFESDETLYSADAFPGFIGKVDNGYDCYGFPSIKGSGVKVGSYDFGQDTKAEEINFTYGAYKEDEDVVRSFLNKYLPEAAGDLMHGIVCIYQNTPDHDFIIDFHPEHKNVLIATGFSGHGFKFVPVIGEILSQLAQRGETEFDITAFALDREGIIVE